MFLKRGIHAIVNRQFIKRSLFIKTETTPNEHALKFIPGDKKIILDSNKKNDDGKGNQNGIELDIQDYLSGTISRKSPLANRLFEIQGISSIFFSRNFISINKNKDQDWSNLKPQIYSILMEHFSPENPEPVLLNKEEQSKFNSSIKNQSDNEIESSSPIFDESKLNEKDKESYRKIHEILDTRIRPLIERDGGDVQFIGYHDGIVKLKLRGACRTCSSSAITLKNGIEKMLMHYIPEVKEVVQEDELGTEQQDEYFKIIKENLDQKNKE